MHTEMTRLRTSLATLALVGGIGLAAPASAQSLEGSWRGGGTVQLASGAIEKARCRASFTRKSGTLYGMSAVCATASASVKQTAQVNRVGDNHYGGEFYNAEFGVRGAINITIRGDSMTASLDGGAGSATLHLSR